jgi:cation diffusion facilitator family transporter
MSQSAAGHIIQSLIANAVIAAAKGVAAVFTGSGAMLAETIHSAADCGNQLLLLLGVRAAAKPATEEHPLGFGRAIYFWSFIVALMLFLGGGVFSIYEGVHKLQHPEPVKMVGVGVAILLFSIAVEGYATKSNIKEIRKRKGALSFFGYLRSTKDSDLVVVFGENAAATLGLIFALLALLAAWVTGDSRYDAIGSAVIGAILVVVAAFLAVEIKSLLYGESAGGDIRAAVEQMLPQEPRLTRLLHFVSLQQGPGQVLVLMKVGFRPELSFEQVSDAINSFERALRSVKPEVRWCFIEPDRPRAEG